MNPSRELMDDVFKRCDAATKIACQPYLVAAARALALDVSDNHVTAKAARTALVHTALEFNVEPGVILAEFRRARDQFDSEFLTAKCVKLPKVVRW